MLTKLDEQQARAILTEKRIGHLGCVVDGGPYIVPINYFFAEDCIYSHSLPGLKISALRENPRACLQVDDISSDLNWRSVLAFGRFEEVTSTDERGKVLNKLLERCPTLTPVESAIAEDGGPPPVIVFRIRIDQITSVAEG